MTVREFNGPYTADRLDRIAFPLGGIGAGMLALDGSGGIGRAAAHLITHGAIDEALDFSGSGGLTSRPPGYYR